MTLSGQFKGSLLASVFLCLIELVLCTSALYVTVELKFILPQNHKIRIFPLIFADFITFAQCKGARFEGQAEELHQASTAVVIGQLSHQRVSTPLNTKPPSSVAG